MRNSSIWQRTSTDTKTYRVINCCSRLVTHSGISDRFFIAQFARSPWSHSLPNVQMHFLPPTKLIVMARANAGRNQQRFPMVIADRPFGIHLSVCWRKRHTHARIRTHARTHAHTHTHTRAQWCLRCSAWLVPDTVEHKGWRWRPRGILAVCGPILMQFFLDDIWTPNRLKWEKRFLWEKFKKPENVLKRPCLLMSKRENFRLNLFLKLEAWIYKQVSRFLNFVSSNDMAQNVHVCKNERFFFLEKGSKTRKGHWISKIARTVLETKYW